MTQHSDLPWTIDGRYVMGPPEIDDDGDEVWPFVAIAKGYSEGEDTANAEFIVRAANSHHKLVEALESAYSAIVADLQHHRIQHIEGCGCLYIEGRDKQIEAALQLARGEE